MCLATIAWHLVARCVLHVSDAASNLPLLIAIVIGGAPLLFTLARKVIAGDFGSDLLAGISILTSIALGEYLAGAVVVLMLSGGTSLENFASRRASSVLNALAKRMPQIAHRQTASGVTDIDLAEVRVGDILEIFPHESCPVDGVVVAGHGTMDESYLTGEPYLISKTAGSTVLSGAVNGEAALTIRVEKLPADSRYAQIVRVMQEAELHRPKFRRVGDRLGAWYTAFALAIAIAAWIIGRNPERFLAVVVIATPCPLLLAIPVAIIGAISVAASRAIIVKDAAMLERVDGCRTIILDKTGTLTYGEPALTEVLPGPGMDEPTAIAIAASLEQYSRHPLASAILNAARRQSIDFLPVSEIAERPGKGLTGLVNGLRAQITSRSKVLRGSPDLAAQLPKTAAGMESILLVDGAYAATFRFRDIARRDARSFISHLKPKHGVRRVMLLSGDRESEVLYLAAQVGIQEALAGKSPEEKVEIVKRETERGPTMFLGDGINDAPAMQAATVGIAFGNNSDVTAEAADAVILDPSLRKVDELIHLGRRMRRIALESAVGGMALSIIGMFIAAAGHLPPVTGAIAQEVIDLLAVLNALRAALPVRELASDQPADEAALPRSNLATSSRSAESRTGLLK
jgi:heavy metal translocating P-type ATPase